MLLRVVVDDHQWTVVCHICIMMLFKRLLLSVECLCLCEVSGMLGVFSVLGWGGFFIWWCFGCAF